MGVSHLNSEGDVGLERATFSVSRQELVFLVGATGSGKSTVMGLLRRELEPSEGSIRVAGRDLAEIDRRWVPFYRRNLGVVLRESELLLNQTVYDNVAHALQGTGTRHERIRDTVVDRLRRRVIELRRGRIVRDEAGGLYGPGEESTEQFGERLRRQARQ